jgi:hypothetical protein
MFLIGEFQDKQALIDAILNLRKEGVTDAQLDIFSEEPVEFRKGILDRPSKMSLMAVLGGAITGITLTYFIYWAQHNYTVITGGMPTFSWWATGVISFEMTMLGAVLCSFAWFLWESGLIRKRDKTVPIPLVPPGFTCLRVRCDDSKSASVSDTMRTAGAHSVVQKVSA